MTNDDIKKIYVTDQGTVTFSCPKCRAMRQEPAQKYEKHKGVLKLECSCSHIYEVQLEFRKYYRKETNLNGLYLRSSHGGDREEMIVKNLSMVGCAFQTLKKSALVVGEELKIEFTLDDPRRSIVRKRAVVTSVEDRYVGCRFVEQTGVYDPGLGFYLKPGN
jgi:hypothetical protein